MSDLRTVQVSFGGGIVSPELHGRIDDSKYASGLADCVNFLIRPQGSVENRSGTQFVSSARYSNQRARLIPFEIQADASNAWDRSVALEFGAGYVRFYADGQLSPSICLTPYSEDEVFDLHYVQSNDVMTVVHPNHPPHELRRYGQHSWQFVPIDFAAAISAPTGVTATAFYGTSIETIRYKVSYVKRFIFSGQDPELNPSLPLLRVESEAHEVSIDVPAGSNYKVTVNVRTMFQLEEGTDENNVFLRYSIRLYRSMNNSPFRFLEEKNWDAGLMYTGIFFNDTGAPTFDTVTYPAFSTSAQFNQQPPPRPNNAVAAYSGTQAQTQHAYVVTTVLHDGITESAASQVAYVDNDLLNPGAFNRIDWYLDPLYSVLASGFNIYKRVAGVFGYIGSTEGLVMNFRDTNITPDTSKTPPIREPIFDGWGKYPTAVGYIEQRRVFAGTNSEPQTVWMTRSGTESDMSFCIPSQDDDRVKFRVVSHGRNQIRHVVSLVDLVLLTNSTEFRATSVNKDAITPSSINVSAQSYVGSSMVQPVLANNTLLHCAVRGGHVYELSYDSQYGGFRTGDVSIRVPHLFNAQRVVDMAYQKAPYPIVWCVLSNGELLGLTYVPEQQVGAWHRHTTDGAFESVACVPEGDEDSVYVIVRRTINNSTVRYVERMTSRKDGIFVDAGTVRTGSNQTAFSGLSHLYGCTVAVLADGGEHRDCTVSGAGITLDAPASRVVAGLPIRAELKTLPAVIQSQSGPIAMGRGKNIGRVFLRVHETNGLSVSSGERGFEFKERSRETFGAAPDRQNGEIDVLPSADWNKEGQYRIVQTKPFPATVLSLCADVSIGG
ncbi:MAG: hypothetical protein LBI35_02595 [Burkholderiales bacterium]|jgi:hypothetical protein|nr:hypothetical protein [Burkholderiales bacterium]